MSSWVGSWATKNPNFSSFPPLFYRPTIFQKFSVPPSYLMILRFHIWLKLNSHMVKIKMPKIKFQFWKACKYSPTTVWKVKLHWKVGLVQEDLLILLVKQVLQEITLRSVKFPRSKFPKFMLPPLYFPHQISNFSFSPYLKKGAKSESPLYKGGRTLWLQIE